MGFSAATPTRCDGSTSTTDSRPTSRRPRERPRGRRIERIAGPCPDEALGDMRVLREAMNDAPEPGEPETFPRIRGEEESLAALTETAYTVVARHRASEEPASLELRLRPRYGR